MKITREQLKKMIAESIQENKSILLEMPEEMPDWAPEDMARSGHTEDPSQNEGEMAKRSLFHVAQQAQQLHDILKDDSDLEPWVQEKVTKVAADLEDVFKAIIYDKQNPLGR